MSDEINAFESKVLGLEEGSRKEELTINTFSIEEARVKAELAGMNAEFAQYEGVELDMEKSEEKLKKEISDFEKMMANIGNVNLRALEIYETVEKEYNVLIEKKNSLVGEKDDVIKMMDEIEVNKKGLFMGTLDVVNKNFVDIFTALSTKGDAFLELENPESPFEEGLRIKVKLTGKKFMDIRSLSGGEKTLTALAFLFAIQEHEPASFYVLDEVDAALDKANSDKLAKLIRDYCTNAQYVVISHNDAVISEADALYGVSMQVDAGLSNVVSLDITKAKKEVKA
jgi:chromosome segregation protein